MRTFTSIDQIIQADVTQQQFFVKHFLTTFNKIVSCHAYMLPTITASCFIDNCIESGKVLQQGGAPHRYSTVGVTSIANLADSLAAIQVCVFDKKYLTMAELMDLLATDFEGREDMRQLLLNKAPKYGNDEELVDEYARWIADQCNEDIVQYTDGRGGRFTTVYATQSYNVVIGRMVGATPDGRRAFTDLADNASPTNGLDCCGPTAVVKSVARLDHLVPQNGRHPGRKGSGHSGNGGPFLLHHARRAHPGHRGRHRHPAFRPEGPQGLPKHYGPRGRLLRLLRGAGQTCPG